LWSRNEGIPFGLVARDEATIRSDVDLMAEFDSRRKLSLLDLVGPDRLSEILQIKVDLTPAKKLKNAFA
jgi:predicted nucleotidyltransferase